jgi:hypothetical protein
MTYRMRKGGRFVRYNKKVLLCLRQKKIELVQIEKKLVHSSIFGGRLKIIKGSIFRPFEPFHGAKNFQTFHVWTLLQAKPVTSHKPVTSLLPCFVTSLLAALFASNINRDPDHRLFLIIIRLKRVDLCS